MIRMCAESGSLRCPMFNDQDGEKGRDEQAIRASMAARSGEGKGGQKDGNGDSNTAAS